MRRFLTAMMMAWVLAGLVGCCASPSQVPVSLEGLYDWWHYHGQACRRGPSSCPCCPYYDYSNCQWLGTCEAQACQCSSGQTVEASKAPADVVTPAPKPAAKTSAGAAKDG